VGSPLSEFVPQFNLRGLGLAYQNGPLEIGGAFLRVQVDSPQGKYDEYDGAAIIKTEQLTLSAIGSYSRLNGQPSLFIYAVLDYPLGGPSFFFVTGLTAGFGYNRSLQIPSIDQMPRFPLVAEAVNPSPQPSAIPGQPDAPPTQPPSNTTGLTDMLARLRTYIPPSTGDIFLAIGIKFTSFKMIDSFALLTVAFGNRFEVDILGLSTLITPTPEAGQTVTPLAEVQMALRARFVPDEGFLGVQAQLTSASYILSRNCYLTGGFAFYSWFSGQHAGDFVQTLGGYHPNFKVPAHYPQVPRLGFTWRVDDNLSIKGTAYYALTASALMAGGYLEATWQSGDLSAWFNAGADFLIAWKPYHYEARIYVDMRVTAPLVNVSVGADLSIWGPEFAGKAHIKLSIISFDVEFGPSASPKSSAISWATFKQSFLPADEAICSLVLKNGLVSTPEDGSIDWVVNPKELSLVTNSVIPAKEAIYPDQSQINDSSHQTTFGIGSMAVTSDNLTTKQTITITRGGESVEDESVEDEFAYTPILKKAPAGLWGQSLTPRLNGPRFIDDTLAGFEITPQAAPTPGQTDDIEVSQLQYSTESVAGYNWEIIKSFEASKEDDAQRTDTIRNTLVETTTVAARNDLLAALKLPDSEINVTVSTADNFLIAPEIETVSA
jgi:hypothetical protein